MICDVPEWGGIIFNYLYDGKIDIITFENAIKWLIQKGLILCTNQL